GLLPELAGGPQPGRLRAGVRRDLIRGRHDRAPVDELGLRRPAAAAHWEVGRADAASGPVREEALDAPVLERLEADRRQAALGREDLPGERERLVELRELAVDGDPDGLERPLGWVAVGEAGGRRDRGGDRVVELEGGGERAAADDLPRDPVG